MITKLNETYSLVQTNEPQKLIEFLKVLKPDAYFNKMIKLGFESPYRYFAYQKGSNVIIFNGHRYLLKSFGIEAIDESNSITENEVQEFLNTLELPFEPYDYQIKTVKLCLTQNKVLIRSVTSCLDPNTEIDVDIPGYTEQEIKEMLDEKTFKI